MSESKCNCHGAGFPICTVLFLIFLVLKLTGNICWSWWWVSSPLWIPVLVFAIACCVIAMGYGAWYLVAGRKQ